MKKLTAILLAIGLLCMLAMPAMAASEPVITRQPQNPTYNEYATAMYTVTAHGSNLSCTWYMEYEGKTYNISNLSVGVQPWEGFAGETYGPMAPSTNGSFTTFTYFFGGIGPELSGARIYAVVEDGHYEVTSAKSVIQVVDGVGTPPEIKVVPSMEVYQDEVLDLFCDATDPRGGNLSYLWYETSTGKLENIIAINRGSEERDTLRVDTSATGTRYYVCSVGTSNGGSAYSSVIPVTVLEKSDIAVKFTNDSVSHVGYTMTVDIEAMRDEDARIWNAFLERDVQYQWYKDGMPIAGANTKSLKMLEEYEGCYIHVAVTCYDLVMCCIPFEVTKETAAFGIQSDTVPDGKVGESYSFQLDANDPDAYFQIYYNPGKPNEFEETGLSLSTDGKISGTPNKAGEYTFTIHASCARGEDYRILTLTVTEGDETRLELLEAPDKVEYYAGETLDLTGLKVRVYNPDGTYFDSLDGDNLTIFDGPLENLGERKIKISYGEAFTFFYVTVKEGTTEPTEPADPTDPTKPSEEPTAPAEAPTEPSKDADVVKPTTTDEANENDAQKKDGMPWWGILLIAIAAAGGGVAVTLLVLKKKK